MAQKASVPHHVPFPGIVSSCSHSLSGPWQDSRVGLGSLKAYGHGIWHLGVTAGGGALCSPVDCYDWEDPNPAFSQLPRELSMINNPMLGWPTWTSGTEKRGYPTLPLALTRAAPACGYHGLLRSNHTLLCLSKVGRPGAHHPVRVLYSYHEVSGLSLSLRPGGTLASVSYLRPCSEQGISSVPPFSFFGATFIL